jgi:hypothetical protein
MGHHSTAIMQFNRERNIMYIEPIGLFNTPESWEDVMTWINSHNPEDRAHLVTAAGMAWNLACSISNTKPPTMTLGDVIKKEKEAGGR